ncbi:uncharacterized protein LOC133392250 [Anopheles gambiae]|uniref:uncharacterized protein LOC133392250 n=1 Tax=Anopheles gambiae TaxID=7165 RepID=UPI002AC8B00D|nr:uncharacterized protein LOC133392250 [Anopheles gambiae]
MRFTLTDTKMDTKPAPKNQKKEQLEVKVLDEGLTPSTGPSSVPSPQRVPSPQPGRSGYPASPRPNIAPNVTARAIKRRRLIVSRALHEELMESLRAFQSATTEMLNRLKRPTDPVDAELSGMSHVIRNWSPERRRRCLIRMQRIVIEEEADHFEKNFGRKIGEVKKVT